MFCENLQICKSKTLSIYENITVLFYKSSTQKLLMPSPSADSKFVLSILKFFKHAQFFMNTQNHFGILKSEILLHKLAHLSIA